MKKTFKVAEARAAGLTISELQIAGYTAKAMKDAGYSLIEIAESQCFSLSKLRCLGLEALDALNAHYSIAELFKNHYDVSELCGCIDIDAAQIRLLRDSGMPCSAVYKTGVSFKVAGDAGYTLTERVRAGYNRRDFKNAGISFREFIDLNFMYKSAYEVGYDAKFFKEAGVPLREFIGAGFSWKEASDVGYDGNGPRGHPKIFDFDIF